MGNGILESGPGMCERLEDVGGVWGTARSSGRWSSGTGEGEGRGARGERSRRQHEGPLELD